MKPLIIRFLKLIGLYKQYRVPLSVSDNYISITEDKTSLIRSLLYAYCKPENYITSEKREVDVHALLKQRLDLFRAQHIPFLAETVGLKGKKILEIGCGTGSSTLALAEQGANVLGIDIDSEAINVAGRRTEIYGVDCSFQEMNALEIEEKCGAQEWDIIIFYASLEHMTPIERKKALSAAYKIVKKGSFVCVFGTPNRMWPQDIHTSWLPFYMWLQDEVALDYARFSKRKEFAKMHEKTMAEGYEDFYRWGRGVSFHEFELAIKPVHELKVVGALPIFLRRYSFIQQISYKRSLEYRFKSCMQAYGPNGVHPGFYEPYMDVIVEKN